MPLNVGTRLGHYDVTALLGEGGMGQVSRARPKMTGSGISEAREFPVVPAPPTRMDVSDER